MPRRIAALRIVHMGGGGVLADAGDQLQALLAIASSNPTALVTSGQ